METESEERKRSFDQVEQPEFEVSKKPLQTISEGGPLTQVDVVFFKKEAIWRQMKFYKLQVNELNRELTKYEKRYQAFVVVHLLLESWYSQVLKICHIEQTDKLDLTQNVLEVESILDDRRQKLASILKPIVPHDDLLSHLVDVVKLESEKDTAEKLKGDLEDKLTALQAQLQALQKEKDRTESATLQRINHSNQVKSEESELKPNGVPHGNGVNEDVSAPPDDAASSAEKEELEKLRIEFEEMKAGHKSLNDEMKEVSQKLSQAEANNQALRERLNKLGDSDLSRSSRFLSLVDQNKSLSESAAQASKLKDELVGKLRELEDREGNMTKGINKELEEENKHLKESLSKSENDLVRIRTARDELLGKQTILKLEIDSKKTNEDVNKLNQILTDRLAQLEKTRQNEYDTDAKMEQLDKEELVRRLQIMSGEVKEIEQAFQDTRSITLEKMKETIDHVSMVKKLTIEKNKADQKYFASMRLKDLLMAENKILKSQISKSLELVTKLNDLEKSYVSKIEILTKGVNDYRVIKESSIQDNAKLQDNIRLLTKSREAVGKELSTVKHELGDVKKEKGELAMELKTRKIAESKLEAKLKATESLLLKYKLNNTSSILQEDEKQLEALRSITKCSVCSKNWKNTVITACGHVFCDGCVQERLAARLRRCPSCNKGFSSNDLLSIHL